MTDVSQPTAQRTSTLGAHTKQLIERLSLGNCADPFGCLGPYAFYPQAGVRVFLPGAKAVVLWDTKQKQVHMNAVGDGLFEYQCQDADELDLSLYQLGIDWGNCQETIYDPYQFHHIMPSLFDLHNPNQAYRDMGAQKHQIQVGDTLISGVRFLVYAPNASAISVVSSFNLWNGTRHPLQRLNDGYWGVFIPGIDDGAQYKYEIKNNAGHSLPHKADPWGFQSESFPSLTSVVYDHSAYQWQDEA
ncbi:MAG: GlgB N-terminal domain-containing protein, partial [Vibrio sp.]